MNSKEDFVSEDSERKVAFYNLQRLSARLHAEASRVERGGSCVESSLLREVAHLVKNSAVKMPPEDWDSIDRPKIDEREILFPDIPKGGHRQRFSQSG